MNPSTQAALLADLVSSPRRPGHSQVAHRERHGGNDFRQIIRELQPKTRVFLSTINWWSCVDVSRFVEEPGDHAGEAETAAMLHLAPELVRPLERSGPGPRSRVATHRRARGVGVGSATMDAGDGRHGHRQSGEGDGAEGRSVCRGGGRADRGLPRGARGAPAGRSVPGIAEQRHDGTAEMLLITQRSQRARRRTQRTPDCIPDGARRSGSFHPVLSRSLFTALAVAVQYPSVPVSVPSRVTLKPAERRPTRRTSPRSRRRISRTPLSA